MTIEQPESELNILRVNVGTHVEVELIGGTGDRERLAFDIVPDSQADFAAGFLGAGTPLAQAILWQRAGSVVPYRQADVCEVHIVEVTSGRHAPAPDAAAARQAAVQEAVSKSNLEDAVRLALTVDVKWGDYDPEGIESGWSA